MSGVTTNTRLVREIEETAGEARELKAMIGLAETKAQAAQAAFQERFEAWSQRIEAQQSQTLKAISEHTRALVAKLEESGRCLSHRQRSVERVLVVDLQGLETNFSAKPVTLELDERFGPEHQAERQALRGLKADLAKKQESIALAVKEHAELKAKVANLRQELSRFQSLV